MKMAFCLRAIKTLGDQDLSSLTDKVESYVKAGMESKAAEMAAVDDMLAEVRQDRDELHSAIREQHPEMFAQPKKAAPAAVKEAKPGAVENFGEALPPGRRQRTAALDKTLSDDDIERMPLSEFWPLAENEAIEDKFAAAVAHAARAEVPAKPRKGYKLDRWVQSVKTVRNLSKLVLSGGVTPEQFKEKAGSSYAMESFISKVALLNAIDRAQWKRIGAVREMPSAATFEDGKRVVQPMVAVDIDGKNHWLKGGGSIADHLDAINALLGEPAQDKKLAFEVRGSGNKFFINKKGDSEYRHLMEFATAEEASKARREKYDDLVKAWNAVKDRDNVTERDLRSDENKDRIGKDWRQGKDISGDDFDAKFGFKGGEFGKWVSQGDGARERQWMLNRAYDALMDLAELVGIPPRAISLNGTMGIAFGSRGSGWASAHFEPGNLVINLTKTRGAGALAHEWFHALDNYFARSRGGEVPFNGNQKDYRDNNYITHKPEPLMVREGIGYGSKMTKAELERRRAQQPQSGYYKAENWKVDPTHPAGVRPQVEERFAALVSALNDAPMTKRAALIDKGTGYWSQLLERAARSFEAYVNVRLAEKGQRNDYLANITPLDEFVRDKGRYPYPTPDEIKPVADAFDALFGSLETKTDEAGNVALVGKSDASLARDAMGRADLTPTEIASLEREYGTANGTAPFHERLAQDVATYISKGAEAISQALRSIVGKVAKAILAVAVVFNVSGLNPYFSSEAYARATAGTPKTVTISKTVQFKQEGKADFNGRTLSPNATKVANWIGAQNRPSEVSLILDPATGRMYVMRGGKIEADSPALYGKQGVAAISEKALNASIDNTTDDLKVTPAGRFPIEYQEGGEYGSQLMFLRGKDAAYAIHRVYLGDPSERRAQRLASSNPSDRGISFGCVNVSNEFYDKTLKRLNYSGDAYAYLLPSDASQLDALVPTPNNTLSRTDTQTFTEGAEQVSSDPGRNQGNLGFADRRRTAQRSATRRRTEGGTDDAGNMAMFSRASSKQIDKVVSVWKRLSESDQLFRMQRSSAKDFEQIASDVGIGLHVERQPLRKNEPDYAKVWSATPIGIDGLPAKDRAGYVIEFKDGAVEINVERFKEGDAGWRVYAVAGNYAHNNGLMFNGDRQGISEAGIERRLENMISLALKFGTTDFMAPHPDQLKKLGFDWRAGDTDYNLGQMLEASHRVLTDKYPELKDLIYDFPTGTFKSLKSGNAVDVAGINQIALAARAAEARVGKTSIQRVAVTNAILRGAVPEDRGALRGPDAGVVSQPLDPSLVKLQYSRTPNGLGIPMRDAQAAAQAIREANPTAPQIIVHESISQAPQALQDDIRKAGAENDVEAALHDGVIHVFPQHMASIERMLFVVGHHEIRHHGLRAILGDRLGPVLLSMHQGNANLRAATQAKIDEGLTKSKITAIDEALADMPVEELTKLNGWDKIVTAVRQWLRNFAAKIRRTMPNLADAIDPKEWTDRDVAAMVMRAEKISRGGSSGYRQNGTVFSNREGNDYGQGFWRSLGRFHQRLANARLPDAILGRYGRRHGDFAELQAAHTTTGFEAVRFKDDIGGWKDFVSLAEKDDAHSGMSMFVVPEALMDKASDADIADKNWMFENSVLTISLRGDKANGYELSVQTPQPGDAAFDQAAPGTFKPTGQLDKGLVVEYHRVSIGAAATKDYLSEAVRRFALHYGFTPDVRFARDTGANPTSDQRTIPASSIETRFSRAPTGATGMAANNRQSIADKLRGAGGGPKIVGQTNRAYTPSQLAAMRNVGFQVEAPTLEQRVKAIWKDAGKKLAQGLVDQFAPVKSLDGEAYSLLRLAKGASGAFETLLQGGKLKLNSGVYDFDDQAKGGVIDTLLKPLGGEHHDFFRWIAANRAERLTSEGKENLFSASDIDSLKTLADGTATFDYTIQNGTRAGQTTRDRSVIYADALKTFNGFNKNVLDMAEQSGLIDGESRAIWEHDFYVPFYRVADDSGGGVRGMNIKGGVVRQQAFKALKGGAQALNADLLDNTLMNWAHLIDASAKNRAAKATLEAAERMGVAINSTEEASRQMAKSMDQKDSVVWFMDEGVKRFFVVEDPMLLTAISALEYAGMRSPIMTALGSFKHALTVGVTASPFFKVRNLIRDSVQAIGTAPIGYNPLANVAQGWALTDPKSDAYFRLLAGGGTIHFGTMMEGSEAKRVQALVESGVDSATILSSDKKVKAFYRKWIEPSITAYNEIGNRGEAITRAALYAQLTKQGMSHAQASLQARDLMDFSMQGSFTSVRFLTQVVPFFNARIQGLYKLGRAAKEDPARFSAVVGAATLAGLGLMLAFGDDDDWKKREDWDRNNFWWFKFGGTAFRIPKPFEIGAIASLAERGFELAFDKEMTGRRFRNNVLALLGDNLSMNPIPQLAKPMLDVYANKDSFTGRPIETMGMERLAPDYRFNSGTSMLARGASTALNTVAGTVGAQSLSPVQIDHMLRGYFGWLGTFVVGAGDVLARPLTGQPEKPDSDLFKAATGGMVSDLRDAPSRYVTQMYEQAKVVEQSYATWRELLKEGKASEAQEFFADHQSDIAKYKMIEHTKTAEAKIGQQVRRVEASDLTGAEKRERIRDLLARKDRIARPVAEVL